MLSIKCAVDFQPDKSKRAYINNALLTELVKICYYLIVILMRKKIIVCFISFLLIKVTAAFSTSISFDINIDVKTNRTSAVYLCGDQAVFLITLKMNSRPLKAGKIRVKLSLDGLNRIKDQEIKLFNTYCRIRNR